MNKVLMVCHGCILFRDPCANNAYDLKDSAMKQIEGTGISMPAYREKQL